MSFCAPVGLEVIDFNDTMDCRPLCPAPTVKVSGKVGRVEGGKSSLINDELIEEVKEEDLY